MNMKRRLTAVIIAALLLSTGIAEENGGTQSMNKYIEMMEADVPNDRKSLYWDGENLTVIDDALDDDTLMDGRGGEYSISRVKAALGRVYSIDREDLLGKDHVLQDDGSCFAAESANRFLQISRQNYAEAKAQYEADLAEKTITAWSATAQIDGLCAKGLLTSPNGHTMAGIRVIVAGDDGSALVYSYGGIGNFSDILVEGNMFAQKTIG